MKLSEIKLENVIGLHMHENEQDYKVKVHDQQSLDRIKGKLMNKFGDVEISVNREAEWFEAVTITSENWQTAHKAFCDNKSAHMARY